MGGALPPVTTSSTLLRTPHSAPPQASAATEATQHGAGSRTLVLSLAETTPMPALVRPACHTALRLALTMSLPLRSTLRAHPVSTHLHHASMHALTLATPEATLATRSRQHALTPCEVRIRSSRIS